MRLVINERVSVVSSYDAMSGVSYPRRFRWKGRDYSIIKRAYHHVVTEGEELCHVYSVSDEANDYRLKLNTKSMAWTLEMVSDGS